MVQQSTNELQIVVKALSYVRTHWYVFLLEAVLLSLVTTYQFRTAPSLYESSTSLLIDSSRRNVYQSVVQSPASQNSNARKQNITYLLGSHDLMEKLRLRLMEFNISEGRPNYMREFVPKDKAIGIRSLKGYVNLTWDKNSDIYSIRCQGETPEGAYAICFCYLGTIQSTYPEFGQRESVMKKDFLVKQIASLSTQVEQKEQALSDFQRKNADFIQFLILDPDDKGFQKLQLEANDLRQQLATNREVKRLMLSIPASKRGEYLARSRSIEALTARIVELQYQRELTSQAKTDPDRYSKMASLDREMSAIQQQLGRLNLEDVENSVKMPVQSTDVRKRISELELEFRLSSIKLKNVEKQIEELRRKDQLYQSDRLKYERMQSDLVNKRKLLQNLFIKEQDTDLEISAGGAEVFRLQEPTKNTYRIAPKLGRFIYGTISIFVFCSIVTMVLFSIMMPRLDSEAEVTRLNLPVLGKVPAMSVSGNFEEMPSLGFEFLKIMNYRILRETKDVRCPVIIISSSHSREGKSTVSQLLSLASQAPNRKTLMIDGDLLTAHPTRFFGVDEDQTPGLHSILEGKFLTNPQSTIVKTVHEGISFMPRGGRIEPTSSPNFLEPAKTVLAILRKEYDLIIVDTPPLFASNLAYQWAGIGDLIVLVARIFVTKPKDIVEALQTCKVFSKAPIGIALNCVPMTGQARKVSNYYFSNRKHRPTRLAA